MLHEGDVSVFNILELKEVVFSLSFVENNFDLLLLLFHLDLFGSTHSLFLNLLLEPFGNTCSFSKSWVRAFSLLFRLFAITLRASVVRPAIVFIFILG